MKGSPKQPGRWIAGWRSRIARSAAGVDRLYLSIDAATFLSDAPDVLREQLDEALDAIAEEPSGGYPGRYQAPAGDAIVDLNVPGHRVVYDRSLVRRRINVRLIEPIPGKTEAHPDAVEAG